jgi:hypothetical protein
MVTLEWMLCGRSVKRSSTSSLWLAGYQPPHRYDKAHQILEKQDTYIPAFSCYHLARERGLGRLQHWAKDLVHPGEKDRNDGFCVQAHAPHLYEGQPRFMRGGDDAPSPVVVK